MRSSTVPEERFRELFHQLDADGVWAALLPPPALRSARAAAETPSAWQPFLAADTQSFLPPPPAPAPASPRTPPRSPKAGTRPSTCGSSKSRQPRVAATPGRSAPPSESPRSRRRDPSDEDATKLLSAAVRRRLAIASVDAHVFQGVPAALPIDDARYEIDHGMLPGDDGGHTSFETLLQEEFSSLGAQTAVYALLGSDDDPGTSTSEQVLQGEDGARDRLGKPASNPKRPRRTPALGLAERMETFVRELRELCEPHRDAAQEESAQSKGVPKNIHRKAVSAASVVEELKEMEHKARIGKFERVEECISAVSACIGNQDETFAEVLSQINERADVLREEYRRRKELLTATARIKALTTGILGSEGTQVNTIDVQGETEVAQDHIGGANGDSWSPAVGKLHIPFSEVDLQCWPSGDDPLPSELLVPRPRLPMFQSAPDEGEAFLLTGQNEDHVKQDDLVANLGLETPIIKNVLGLLRIRRLRETGFAKLAVLTEHRADTLTKSATTKRSSLQQRSGNSTKMEVVLPVRTAEANGPTPDTNSFSQQELLKRRNSIEVKEATIQELEITNDAFDESCDAKNVHGSPEPRERALGRAVCALMCCHGGFTHASSAALDILTDALENFVVRIGQSLGSCRENIDRDERDGDSRGVQRVRTTDIFEELRLISASGFRGGFPRLLNYVKSELLRIEQTIRDSELRLRAQIAQLEMIAAGSKSSPALSSKETAATPEPSAIISPVFARERSENKHPSTTGTVRESSTDARLEEIRLDDTAFMFGYLNESVCFDVLGSIRVPRQLALATLRTSFQTADQSRSAETESKDEIPDKSRIPST